MRIMLVEFINFEEMGEFVPPDDLIHVVIAYPRKVVLGLNSPNVFIMLIFFRV